jgi:NAD(P)-dependent dehydrogenase (short-subunit alcohol dehydrogenase family)
VSSIVGRKSYPYHDAYGASKAYVHALTEAARRSMSGCEVRAIVVSPGLRRSAFEETMLNEEARNVWATRRAEIGGGIAATNHALRLSNATGCDPGGACHHTDTARVLGSGSVIVGNYQCGRGADGANRTIP